MTERSLTMKVLLVHNHYRSSMPSGENRVVADELAALRAAGVEVETFFRSSDELETMSATEKARAAISPITGSSSRSEFAAVLRRFRPDVVHLHNPYPLLSPRVIEMAADCGVPTVATIHNFRLQCMNGLLFRDGHICTECEGRKVPVPGIRHKCYRASLVQSTTMAAAITVHRKRWDRVSRFIAVSQFVADRLESWGVAADRVVVKPNPVPDPGPITPPGRGFLYAGRLSEEKGVLLLLDGWELSGLDGAHDLLIAGDGPLVDEVRRRARRLRSVTLLGVLDAVGIHQARLRTAAGILCSLWFEAHPAVAESFVHGRPMLATRVGALNEIIDESVGWRLEPTPEGVASGLRAACDRGALIARGSAARDRYEKVYSPTVIIDQLIRIYDDLVSTA